MQYPLVLKTAAPGILHKSEVGGVILGITDSNQLRTAYQELSLRLGGRAILAEMSLPGQEFALGMTSDPQFGPLIMVASGGIWIEVLKDRAVALPPIDPAAARRLIDDLRSRTLLDGVRGRQPGNVAAFADLVSQFSVMMQAIGDLVEEVDANPVIVTPIGALVVDGVVVPKKR